MKIRQQKNIEQHFVGKDVAEILGYKNARNALYKHVDEEDKLGSRFATSGQNRQNFVGKDVAKILGYVKPANAIKCHVPSSFKGVTEIMIPGGKQKMV